MIIFTHRRVEKKKKKTTMGEGENAGYQHFLLFPQCFPKPSFLPKIELGKEPKM